MRCCWRNHSRRPGERRRNRTRRPGERRDPYAETPVGKEAVRRLWCNNCGLWLWVPARASLGRDDENYSRGADCARSFARNLPPNRGRRESRVRAAPAVSCAMCTKKCAHEHTGSAESIRPSLRNGFTAYSALSPATGLFATVTCGSLHKLDTSIGVPEPHDFAVRIGGARQSQLPRPPHPAPRS